MPTTWSFLRRIDDDPDLEHRYARARSACGDTMDSNVLDVAEQCRAGKIDPQAARVAIDAYKWRAAHLRPQRYGELVRAEVTGAGGEPLTVKVEYEDKPAKVVIEQMPRLIAAPPKKVLDSSDESG